MKKILVSLGLILTLVLCCAFVPVNAAEECTHEKVTFQYFLDEQEKPVTCDQSGIAKYTCDKCEASIYKKEVGKHVVAYEFTDVSCTEAQKVVEKCTLCKTVISETEVTPALGHDWKEVVVAASCDRGAGLATQCANCKEEKSFVAFEEGNELYAPAKGHKWEDTKVVNPTCQKDGYTLQTCANCKKTQEVKGEAAGPQWHKAVLVSTLKEPVCEVNGIGKFKCELCDTEEWYGSIPAEHKWDYANMEIIEAATCGKPGKANLECSLCDAKIEGFVIDNSSIEHEWEEAVLVEDCENPARVGQICKACGKEDVEVVEGTKAKGHAWEEFYKEPTCDKASGILKVCTACDEELFVEFAEGNELYVPAKGHTAKVLPAKAPTCSATGLTEGSVCSVCNKVLVAQKEVAKNPDNHTAKLVDTLKEPGCTTLGVGKYACKDCNKDLGYQSIPTKHNWKLTKTTTAATCAKEGKGTYTCEVCKTTKEDAIAKVAHTFEEKTINKCGEKQRVVEVCKVCKAEGKVKSEGAVVEHTWDAEKVFPATCLSAEFVGKVCLNPECGKIETISVVGKPLGHDWSETLVDASCLKPNGVKRVCTRSGCKVTETEYFTEGHALYVAAKGHTAQTIAAVAATCSATGLTAGSKCKVCGEILTKQETVAKNPDKHTAKLVDTLKAATCTTNGVGKYACKDCGKELGYQSIPAAHTLKLEVITAATCGKDGKGNKVCTVEGCGYIEKDVVIKATGKHNYVKTTIDATCIEPAKVGQECTVCKAQKDVKPVSGSKALGHAYVEAYVEASCEAASGIKTTCERCDYNVFKAFTEADGALYVAAKGHTEVAIKAVAATCSKEGATAGVKCKVCDKVITAPTKTAKNPEAHTEKLVDTLKAKDCKKGVAGVGKFACKDCGKDLGYKAIAATHDYELQVVVAATCAKAGKGNNVCKNCGHTVKDVEIKATGKHNYVQTTIDATCTAPAKVGKECTVCKAQKDVVNVQGSKPLGHALVEEFAEASCELASGIAIECERCDYTDYKAFTEADGELYVAAKGHTEVAIKAVAATCSKEGATAGVKCKVCDKVITAPTKTAKNPDNHTAKLVDTLKANTCTTSGVGKYACKDCNKDLGYKAIPAAHTLIQVVVKAATCGKEGKAYDMCTVAGCKYESKEYATPATGKHNYVADSVIDATCTEPAKAGTICSVCGHAKDDVVAVGQPNGHVWKETPADATCDTPAGVKKVCTVCEAEEFEAYTGELAEAAKGHQYEAKEVAGTCKVAGFTADICKVCGDIQNKVAGTTNPDNHNAKATTIIKAPTCKAPGVAKAVCADCEKELGYIAVPAEHTFGAEYANESGTLVYVKCDDCDTIKVVAYFGTKDVKVGDVFESLEKFEKAEAAK